MDNPPTAERLAAVWRRIATAADRSNRDPRTIRLVAVSKGVDTARIKQAVDAGAADIGENRVQEAERKHAELEGAAVHWHLLGHLQSNKAKRAATLFDAVHSLDSERIARALALARHQDAPPLVALIEVELTGIAGRSGVFEQQAEPLLRSVVGLPGLHVQGLMTIAPPGRDPAEARPYFQQLRVLRDRLEQACGWELPDLSMGMSDDFEVAVEEGATIVRVGRAIFGPRD